MVGNHHMAQPLASISYDNTIVLIVLWFRCGGLGVCAGAALVTLSRFWSSVHLAVHPYTCSNTTLVCAFRHIVIGAQGLHMDKERSCICACSIQPHIIDTSRTQVFTIIITNTQGSGMASTQHQQTHAHLRPPLHHCKVT